MALREQVSGSQPPGAERMHDSLKGHLRTLFDSTITSWLRCDPKTAGEAYLNLVAAHTLPSMMESGRLDVALAEPQGDDVGMEFGYVRNTKKESPFEPAYLPRIISHHRGQLVQPLGRDDGIIPTQAEGVEKIPSHMLVDTYPQYKEASIKVPMVIAALHFEGMAHKDINDAHYFLEHTGVTIADPIDDIFAHAAQVLDLPLSHVMPLIPSDMVAAPGIRQLEALLYPVEGERTRALSFDQEVAAEELLADPMQFVYLRAKVWPKIVSKLVRMPGERLTLQPDHALHLLLQEGTTPRKPGRPKRRAS